MRFGRRTIKLTVLSYGGKKKAPEAAPQAAVQTAPQAAR